MTLRLEAPYRKDAGASALGRSDVRGAVRLCLIQTETPALLQPHHQQFRKPLVNNLSIHRPTHIANHCQLLIVMGHCQCQAARFTSSKTSNMPTLTDQLGELLLPDLEDVEEASSGDRLGGPGIGNFEGFTCLNRPSQLPLDSEVSEGESLLTSAQRTAGTKTTNNLDSEVSEGESLLTPAQRTTGTKNTTNLRDSVKPIQDQETEPPGPAPNSYGKVIIIEPVADAHPVDKFFSNDLTLTL